MARYLKIFFFSLLITAFIFVYRLNNQKNFHSFITFLNEKDTSKPISSEEILKQGNAIIFLETNDTMEPTSLVLCAIESAARVYNDRPVVFFMKSLSKISTDKEENRIKNMFPTLSFYENVYFFPLKMEEVFKDTPLLPWYLKVNPESERYWIHISADGCRLALIWKYGGMYMDSDIISIQPVQAVNFLAAESSRFSSNGALGFSQHHDFLWECMEDFVRNYKGKVWAYQGPLLLTRILAKSCPKHNFTAFEDIMCGNITFINPVRFFKLQYSIWRRFFYVWKVVPNFNDSYGSHFWNHANHVNIKKLCDSW